jgi:hypothetical protein
MGALLARAECDHWAVEALGAPHVGERTEKQLISAFAGKIADASKSYHAAHRVSNEDIFDIRLIFGDNLLALKAPEQEFAGKVKCVFIDPPYNTGSAKVSSRSFYCFDSEARPPIRQRCHRPRTSTVKVLVVQAERPPRI